MSHTDSGDASNYPTSVTLPDDGDTVEAAAFNPAFEGLLDRTEWLKSQLAAPLADVTALAAITAPTDGLIRHVVGQGLYVFKASATTGLSPFRVAAADATPGGWVASHAHETTLSRWVPARFVTAMTNSATPPAADVAVGFRPPLAAEAIVRGGAMKTLTFSTDASNAYGFSIPADRFLVDGAVIVNATVQYKPAPRGTPPTQWPRFAIVRWAKAGAYNQSPDALLSVGAGLVQDSGGTYVSERSLVFTPNQNAVVDLTLYTYEFVFWDEHGTNATAGTELKGVSLQMTISDGRR